MYEMKKNSKLKSNLKLSWTRKLLFSRYIKEKCTLSHTQEIAYDKENLVL